MPNKRERNPIGGWSHFLQNIIRLILVVLIRLVARVQIEGKEHLPKSGSFVLAMNHLHLFDSCLVFCFVPRSLRHIVHTDWQNWFSRYIFKAIYATPQQDDTLAGAGGRAMSLMLSLSVLRAGESLLIAPEGRRSETGGLVRAQSGVACLATQGGVPIIPIVLYGQEKSASFWRRLRRVPVCMRIGPSIHLPTGLIDDAGLQAYTDQIMCQLACMLPVAYRGVYDQAFCDTVFHDKKGHL